MASPKKKNGLTIGMLARKAGVGIPTIRYYQRTGLLDEPERTLGRVRAYGDDHLLQLWIIRHAKELGFTLAEIGELSEHVNMQNCLAIRSLAERKLRLVQTQIRQLGKVRKTLKAIIDGCQKDGPPDEGEPCPVIERFRTNGFDATETP